MIYLAGKYTAKERLKPIRDRLRREGLAVSSSWLDEEATDYNATLEIKVENATRDFMELDAADTIIVDTIDESNTGGREVELGYAMGTNMQTILVGPERNVFHHIVDLWYPDWESLFSNIPSWTL